MAKKRKLYEVPMVAIVVATSKREALEKVEGVYKIGELRQLASSLSDLEEIHLLSLNHVSVMYGFELSEEQQ